MALTPFFFIYCKNLIVFIMLGRSSPDSRSVRLLPRVHHATRRFRRWISVMGNPRRASRSGRPYILVDHLIIYFSVIGSVQIDIETSILILVDVFRVGGIDENLTAGFSNAFGRWKRAGRCSIFPAIPVPFIGRRIVSKPVPR